VECSVASVAYIGPPPFFVPLFKVLVDVLLDLVCRKGNCGLEGVSYLPAIPIGVGRFALLTPRFCEEENLVFIGRQVWIFLPTGLLISCFHMPNVCSLFRGGKQRGRRMRDLKASSSIPTLFLAGNQTSRRRQSDPKTDPGVQVVDQISKDYERCHLLFFPLEERLLYRVVVHGPRNVEIPV